jgi:hypothetical protein
MTKFSTKISLFMTYFFVFFTQPIIFSLFHEIVREHIEYGDVHAYIFSKFLNILKFIFQLMEAYAFGTNDCVPLGFFFSKNVLGVIALRISFFPPRSRTCHGNYTNRRYNFFFLERGRELRKHMLLVFCF